MIEVFMAFFNEKTIKTYKRNRLVADYHKAGAYVRLYGVLNSVEITDMTLSFVAES
jgi:hypothetical protein